jgi:hypothetical protein
LPCRAASECALPSSYSTFKAYDSPECARGSIWIIQNPLLRTFEFTEDIIEYVPLLLCSECSFLAAPPSFFCSHLLPSSPPPLPPLRRSGTQLGLDLSIAVPEHLGCIRGANLLVYLTSCGQPAAPVIFRGYILRSQHSPPQPYQSKEGVVCGAEGTTLIKTTEPLPCRPSQLSGLVRPAQHKQAHTDSVARAALSADSASPPPACSDARSYSIESCCNRRICSFVPYSATTADPYSTSKAWLTTPRAHLSQPWAVTNLLPT